MRRELRVSDHPTVIAPVNHVRPAERPDRQPQTGADVRAPRRGRLRTGESSTRRPPTVYRRHEDGNVDGAAGVERRGRLVRYLNYALAQDHIAACADVRDLEAVWLDEDPGGQSPGH